MRALQWFLIGACLLALAAPVVSKKSRRETPESCPKKKHMLEEGRDCKKSCKTDDDCSGKRKKCLCDDVCGLSCINPKSKCPKPQIENGRVRARRPRFGKKIKYRCDEGFELRGSSTRVCRGDKTWSGEEPRCVRPGLSELQKEDSRTQNCVEPRSLPNADHNGRKTNLFAEHEVLTYSCREGSIQKGEGREAVCKEGQWIGPAITCVEACRFPGDLANGGVLEMSNRVLLQRGRELVYWCRDGYTLEGSSRLTCLPGGKWNATKPKCIPKYADKCPPPKKPEFGSMTNSHREAFGPGEPVTFSCDPGYKLVGGEETRHCLSTMKWSGSDVMCKIVTCPEPAEIVNGKVLITDGLSFQSSIQYKCDKTTTQVGASVAVCKASGQWSEPPPRCYFPCRLPTIANSARFLYKGRSFTEETLSHGVAISVECLGERMATTEEPMVCENGQWLNQPRCIEKSCTNVSPPKVENARSQFFGTNHGDIVKYKCQPGFSLKDYSSQVQCKHGQWVGKVPACTPKTCHHRRELANGYVLMVGMIGKYRYTSSVRSVDHGDLIEYYCNPGYKLTGPVAATCINGEWSPERRPTCVDGKYSHFALGSKLKI